MHTPFKVADPRVTFSCGCGAYVLERVQDCPHLRMRPHPAAGRADIALVELGRNGIVARFPDSTDG